MPALARQNVIACEGKPAQCLMRRKRSSSVAATSSPSRMSAADESPWKQLRPRTIMGKSEQNQSARKFSASPALVVLARGSASETAINQFQRDHAFRQYPLQGVEPAR